MSDQHPTPRTEAQPSPAAAAPAQPYQAPAVSDLGPWQNLTLLYSLPIGPGGPTPQP